MTKYINYNKIFNDIATEQGIEPGSLLWNKGGILPYSGTTGSHAAYGWRHDHKIDAGGLEFVKSVIANYGHRRMYYVNAIARMAGYEAGGRPMGWTPELPGDLPNGEAAYVTSKGIVNVSGPDILHFHIGPLYAVAQSTGFKIKSLGNDYDASVVAKIMINYFVKSLVGQQMKNDTQINSYIPGDRGCSCILEVLVQAEKIGAADASDMLNAANYIEKYMVPFYEKAPGLTLNTKPYEVNGMKNIQLYNGLFWILPTMYWAWEILPTGELKNRMYAIITRWSQWVEDLEKTMPSQGAQISSITITDEIINGDNGKPQPTLLPYLKPENCLFGETDSSLWGLTAQYIAAKVLNSEVLEKSSQALLKKWLPKLSVDNKAWFVGADGNYLV